MLLRLCHSLLKMLKGISQRFHTLPLNLISYHILSQILCSSYDIFHSKTYFHLRPIFLAVPYA